MECLLTVDKILGWRIRGREGEKARLRKARVRDNFLALSRGDMYITQAFTHLSSLNNYSECIFGERERAHNNCICMSHPSLFIIQTCILEAQRLESRTALARHRRTQRILPNGREFSRWLYRSRIKAQAACIGL